MAAEYPAHLTYVSGAGLSEDGSRRDAPLSATPPEMGLEVSDFFHYLKDIQEDDDEDDDPIIIPNYYYCYDSPSIPAPPPYNHITYATATTTPTPAPDQLLHVSPDSAGTSTTHGGTITDKREIKDKVAFKTKSQVEVLDDGFKWRKYGKKMVKNSPNPRNYYRCSTDGCPVKKRVERDSHDPCYVLTTYEGIHNHLAAAAVAAPASPVL